MTNYMRVLALVIVLMGVMSSAMYGEAIGIVVNEYNGRRFATSDTALLKGDYFAVELKSDGSRGNSDDISKILGPNRDFLGFSGRGGSFEIKLNGDAVDGSISLRSIQLGSGRHTLGTLRVESSETGNKYDVKISTFRIQNDSVDSVVILIGVFVKLVNG